MNSPNVINDDPPRALPGENVDQYVKRTARASKKEKHLQLVEALCDVLDAAADGEDAVEAAYTAFRENSKRMELGDKPRIYSLSVPSLFRFVATASARRHELERRVAALEQRLAQGGQS